MESAFEVTVPDRERLVEVGRVCVASPYREVRLGVFAQKGCYGCHAVGNVGALIAPDLSRAGAKHREGELARWLRSPSTQEPTEGARLRELEPGERDMVHLRPHMTTLKLSATEAQALAAYLASLR